METEERVGKQLVGDGEQKRVFDLFLFFKMGVLVAFLCNDENN